MKMNGETEYILNGETQDYKGILNFYPNYTNILNGIVFFRTKKKMFLFLSWKPQKQVNLRLLKIRNYHVWNAP